MRMLWDEQRERHLEEEAPERLLLLYPTPDEAGRPTEFGDPEAVIQRFRSALWEGGLDWEVEERDDSPINHSFVWICPGDMHCWVCFMSVRGNLAEIQVSLPLRDSEWKRRLVSVTDEVVAEVGLSVSVD